MIITVSLNPTIDRVLEVQNFTLGQHQVGREVLRVPGGKAVNVSRVLASLGVRSVITGFLGAENRLQFDPFLKSATVVDEFFVLPGRTRENVTIVDPHAGQETHIRDVGLTVDATNLNRLRKKLDLMGREGSIVIFSGSLPPGVTPLDFQGLVRTCLDTGARVAVDTSGAALHAMTGLPLWLVKPNLAELSELTGRAAQTVTEQLDAACELAATVNTVLLTRGAEGAYLVVEGKVYHGRAALDQARVVSTVGCGDALLATYVAGAVRGLKPPAALRDALACASASACTAAPAEFDADVMDELRATVEVEALPPAP